jgi:hypothetical protein
MKPDIDEKAITIEGQPAHRSTSDPSQVRIAMILSS